MLTEKQAWKRLSKRVKVRGLCILIWDMIDREKIGRETAARMVKKIDTLGPPEGYGWSGDFRWPLSKRGMAQRRAFCRARAKELK